MPELLDVEEPSELTYQQYDEYLNHTLFIVHDICESKKTFKKTLRELYGFLKLGVEFPELQKRMGFESPEVRKHILYYKFTKDEAKPRTMQIRHFIINLMLWSAFIRYERVDELNASQIYDCSNVTKKNLNGYINEHLIAPYRSTIDARTISKALDDCIYMLSMIYIDFALMMGLTMDMETFIDLRNRSERFNELLNTKPEEGMQPKEIEEMISGRLQEYLDIVINQDKTNNLRPFLVTGAGINTGQLAQFSIMDGLKPDIEGNVNPTPIDSNFIKGGLNSISNFYIDGQAGCKPLILNKTVMGKSGYFSYKTMTLSSNYRLSQTVEDCHTARPIKYEVKTKKHLQKIDMRYYYDDLGELHRVDADHDLDLIGKTILLRDPTTCTCKDGICHICYGDAWYANNDPQFHAGRFAATQINEPIQQKILSSKHMLRTVSDKIKFEPDFYRFFILDTNKIKLNMDSTEDLHQWKLFIPTDEFYYIDELSGNDDFNIYVDKFMLWNKKTNELIELKEGMERDMFLFGDTVSQMKKETVNDIPGKTLNLSSLSDEDAIAAINVVNNELSTPLKNIIKLLDRKDHFGCKTIDDMVNNLVQLTIDSDMSVAAVHGSMLIKGLIRDADNILIPPDWNNPKLTDEDYQMLSVSNALIYNPSLSVSFSFDNANKQMISPMTYKKYKPSDYDLFFKEDLYDDSKLFYTSKKQKASLRRMKKYREDYRHKHNKKKSKK